MADEQLERLKREVEFGGVDERHRYRAERKRSGLLLQELEEIWEELAPPPPPLGPIPEDMPKFSGGGTPWKDQYAFHIYCLKIRVKRFSGGSTWRKRDLYGAELMAIEKRYGGEEKGFGVEVLIHKQLQKHAKAGRVEDTLAIIEVTGVESKPLLHRAISNRYERAAEYPLENHLSKYNNVLNAVDIIRKTGISPNSDQAERLYLASAEHCIEAFAGLLLATGIEPSRLAIKVFLANM